MRSHSEDADAVGSSRWSYCHYQLSRVAFILAAPRCADEKQMNGIYPAFPVPPQYLFDGERGPCCLFFSGGEGY